MIAGKDTVCSVYPMTLSLTSTQRPTFLDRVNPHFHVIYAFSKTSSSGEVAKRDP